MIDRRETDYKCAVCSATICRNENVIECMDEYFHEGCFDELMLSDFLKIIGESARYIEFADDEPYFRDE